MRAASSCGAYVFSRLGPHSPGTSLSGFQSASVPILRMGGIDLASIDLDPLRGSLCGLKRYRSRGFGRYQKVWLV
jgi:hypothetical protein